MVDVHMDICIYVDIEYEYVGTDRSGYRYKFM